MARTHRKHAPLSEHKRRGGDTPRNARDAVRREEAGTFKTKPHKQRRVNERASLRKEWL